MHRRSLSCIERIQIFEYLHAFSSNESILKIAVFALEIEDVALKILMAWFHLRLKFTLEFSVSRLFGLETSIFARFFFRPYRVS